MQLVMTAIAVIAGMVFSLAIALLVEELIFGKVFRLFFARRRSAGTNWAEALRRKGELMLFLKYLLMWGGIGMIAGRRGNPRLRPLPGNAVPAGAQRSARPEPLPAAPRDALAQRAWRSRCWRGGRFCWRWVSWSCRAAWRECG